MIKKLIASTAVAMASVLGSPASEAGEIYVNPEYNAGFSGAEFVASSLELHAGFQEGPFYIQAGPALSNDGSDSEWGFSGKTGISAAVSSNIDLYTEVGMAKFDDEDAAYGIKLGGKLVF
tara:strand:+ start:10928 stop:11287 length:360 start_codon:yes stop_codon:yes gene_type:complete